MNLEVWYNVVNASVLFSGEWSTIEFIYMIQFWTVILEIHFHIRVIVRLGGWVWVSITYLFALASSLLRSVAIVVLVSLNDFSEQVYFIAVNKFAARCIPNDNRMSILVASYQHHTTYLYAGRNKNVESAILVVTSWMKDEAREAKRRQSSRSENDGRLSRV